MYVKCTYSTYVKCITNVRIHIFLFSVNNTHFCVNPTVSGMECAIGVAGGAIARPDWWGNQYFMPHQILKQNCQLIVNMLTIM